MDKKGYLKRIEPRIKERLQQLSVSQGWLSQIMNIERSTISRYCAGTLMPRFDRCIEIANVLGCHVDELWTLKENKGVESLNGNLNDKRSVGISQDVPETSPKSL